MSVLIAPAAADEAGILEALLQLYVYDFSEALALDVGDDGRYGVPATEGRDAFLIRVDGKLAGFAFHAGKSRLTGDVGVHDVAEFFVLRRYRRTGVGEHAARWLFDRFPGRWEVRERVENVGAIAFWRRVISALGGDQRSAPVHSALFSQSVRARSASSATGFGFRSLHLS